MNTHLDLKSEEFFSLNATGGQIEDGSPRLRDIQDMGHMLAMAAGTAERCDIELSRMVNLLRGAQNVGQTRVYLNAYGECVGFVAWAFLSPPVEREYLRGNRRPLGEWEYNEGTSAWILDLAVRRGCLKYIMADMRDNIFAQCEQITYSRMRQAKCLTKRLSRNDRSSFMRNGQRASPSWEAR